MMFRDFRIAFIYFAILTIAAILVGALVKFAVTLSRWLEALLSDGSVFRANIAAQLQREQMADSNFSSELFIKALWGWALCVLAYGF